ncbi:ABC transporter ATP-binding protein [Roseobacter sp. N2S]|uniref:ABC transporter ATP-binding protein n=1 Tax=Roseobacter sp. N2S TaxID=2663844 RepID=UPI00285ECC9F|nr:ABC transporter ATP-binding protein [Roseobacter sp. N2S]MDR6266179.1 spermidine/putrescine transport system ATP-binding protein [Roseobacter sp. N2S]
MTQFLELRNARREYDTPEGGKVAALDGINLDVGPNEFVTLLGPSGCGKTTLLRAISGFEQLDDGKMMLDGVDIRNQPAHKRPVNTVFQSYALFSHMSVARNVGYALEVAGVAKADRKARVDATLAKVGLADMGSRKPSQLSGGQRQRVALARAIIAQPKLLLLDEPLSALDRNLRQQMQLELKSLQDDLGIAFIFVTHDQEEALTMSDRIVVMQKGQIEQIGTPREIYRKPRNRFVAEFVGETNLFDVTFADIQNGVATAKTAQGMQLLVQAEGIVSGQTATVILRPSDFRFGGTGKTLSGTVTREVYLGSDLHYLVLPDAGGEEIKVSARDDAGSPEVGAQVTLSYDPAVVHILESR